MNTKQKTEWIFKREEKNQFKIAGANGEKILFNHLLNFAKTAGGVSLIPNSSLYVSEGQKKWTEIDLVMIHNSGIYVFENKFFSGKVSGKINDRLWMKSADTIITIQNPITQNKKHIQALADFLKISESSFKSVIVFSGSCDISACPKSSDKFILCSLSELDSFLRPLFSENIFTDNQVEEIYSRVIKCATVKEKIVEEHLNYVNGIKKRKKEVKKKQ